MTSLNSERRISPLMGMFVLVLVSFLLFPAACSQNPKATPAPSLSPEVPPTPFVRQKEAMPAPPFELTNQFGQTTSLAQLKGKVVVLTFLYTNCPEACPLNS